MGSEKDHREHAIVVEYIMDSLSPLCRDLAIPQGTTLTSTRSMWHLGTRITGRLRDAAMPSVDLAALLHPTPAVCGAPRAADRAAGTLAVTLAAGLVQMAISRTREFSADRDGAEICGKPMALASALAKIANAAGRTVNVPAERNPASAAMFIINPLGGMRMDALFATHPPTQSRIDRLAELAGTRTPGVL